MLMKKITFLLILFTSLSISAQSTVWIDDFNDEDASDWTLIDSDGDGRNWADQFQVDDNTGNPVTPVSLISRSWEFGALTPDNWAISPAINLSGASGTITVDYITQVSANVWDEETYSIHVGTSSDPAVLINSSFSLTETLGDAGDTGSPVNHSFDISGLAGEAQVYIAFRHWNTTNQDFISIDDVAVLAQTLSNDDFDTSEFTSRFDQLTKQYVVSSNTKLTGLNIFNVLGQNTVSVQLNDFNAEVDLSALRSGVYIAEIKAGNATKTAKFIVK